MRIDIISSVLWLGTEYDGSRAEGKDMPEFKFCPYCGAELNEMEARKVCTKN